MKPSRPKVRSNVRVASRSLQLAGTRPFLVFACYLALLTGCGSSDVAFDQAAYQQALQAHNEIHQKTLATIPTGGIAAKVDFPFTASNSFSLVTRSFSFSELSIGAFNDSSPPGVQYQIWPSLTHAFSASNPSVHTEFVIDGIPIDSVVNGVPQVKIVPDGNVMSLTNSQTGDSISLDGLTLREYYRRYKSRHSLHSYVYWRFSSG